MFLDQAASFAKHTIRAGLHYGGEVHRPLKKFSPRHGYFRLREGMHEKMKRQKNILFKLEFSGGQVFCLRL